MCFTMSGIIEYWRGPDGTMPEEAVDFQYKLDTDLYVHAKAKTVAISLEV